ncbi:MAG: SAM-dependent methyltransferase [Bacteroidia bacterium]
MPTLFLIPCPLVASDYSEAAAVALTASIPASVPPLASRLKHWVVESEKESRRYLKALNREIDINALHMTLLNEHSVVRDARKWLEPALEGYDMGLLSDAGCPAVADPGALVVAEAHRLGIQVVPVTGPSSILLTLMASGFNGQKFAFQGYLPVDKAARKKALIDLEAESRQRNMTQLFIEAPYRNNQMLETAVQSLHPNTRLCVGVELTSPRELLISQPVGLWRKGSTPDLHKRPTVFALYAA